MATEGFSKGYAFTMAAGVGSASVNVIEGFERAYLQISTLSSQTALDVYGSSDGGTTYYQIRHSPFATTTTVGAPSFIVAASCMANGAMVPLPPGFQYYTIKCTDSNPSAALGFTLLCNT